MNDKSYRGSSDLGIVDMPVVLVRRDDRVFRPVRMVLM